MEREQEDKMLIQEAIECLNLAIELGINTLEDLEEYMKENKIEKNNLKENLTIDSITKILD